jgi:hypothetical protein
MRVLTILACLATGVLSTAVFVLAVADTLP